MRASFLLKNSTHQPWLMAHLARPWEIKSLKRASDPIRGFLRTYGTEYVPASVEAVCESSTLLCVGGRFMHNNNSIQRVPKTQSNTNKTASGVAAGST